MQMPAGAGAMLILLAAGCITSASGASVMEIRDDGKLQTISQRDEANHASHHYRHARSSIVRAEGGVRAYHAAEATANFRDINRVKVINQAAEDDVDRASLTDRREFAVTTEKPEEAEEAEGEDDEEEEADKKDKKAGKDGKDKKKGGDKEDEEEDGDEGDDDKKDEDEDEDEDESTTSTIDDDEDATSTTTAGNSTNNTNTTTAAPPAAAAGSSAALLAIPLFLIVAVIGALIYVKKQKEKKAKEEADKAAAAAAAAAAPAAKNMTAQQVNRLKKPSVRPPPKPPSVKAPSEPPAEEAAEEPEAPEEVPPPEVEAEDVQNKRFPKEGQRIMMIIDCVSGTDMPDVNSFGGVDPFCEFRLCSGDDPSKKPKGDHQSKAKWTVKTHHESNSHQPQWHANLRLDGGSWLPEQWLQVILWDHGMSGNTAIGHSSMKLQDCLQGLGYEAHVTPPHHNDHVFKFANLMSDTQDLRTAVVTEISFAEIHKYKLTIDHAERFPKVKTLGTIDSFIEWRVEEMDVHKNPFKPKPDETCLASGKTRVQADNIDPEWKQHFEFTVPGLTNLQLQFIVWDQGSLGNTPIIHAAIQMADIAEMSPGHEAKEFKLKFEQLPDNPCEADFAKAFMVVKAEYNHVFAKGL